MPVSSWSTTASSNATADSASGIVWSEGQAPSTINDSARAMMAEVKKWYDTVNPIATRGDNYSLTSYVTYAAITSVIPSDDTIPQNTEGTQILSASITPSASTSKVQGRVSVPLSHSVSGGAAVVAVFRSGVANAVASRIVNATGVAVADFEFTDSPAATSAVTYTVRVGPGSASTTVNINGTTARLLGGSMYATLYLEEVKA